jgi:hypothetical protein
VPFILSLPTGRLNENASTTNKDKAKLKNPLMRRHARERRDKRNLSLADRQVSETARGGETGRPSMSLSHLVNRLVSPPYSPCVCSVLSGSRVRRTAGGASRNPLQRRC